VKKTGENRIRERKQTSVKQSIESGKSERDFMVLSWCAFRDEDKNQSALEEFSAF
jgi:hypothetical protein